MQNCFADIESHRQQALDELQALCRIPSVSTDAAHRADMQTAAQWVAGRLRGLGAQVQVLTVEGSHPYVWGELGSGKRTLLIYDHYDVQPAALADGWSSAPFEPKVSDGRIYARGVADNKSNLMFRLQAIETYLRVFGSLPLRVRFFIEGEEEIGSPHLPAFVRQYPELVRADGCIWESGRRSQEGVPILELGLRGILYVELRLRAESRALHSSWANIVQSPALRLEQRMLQALNSLWDAEGRPIFLQDLIPPVAADDLALLSEIPFAPEIARQEYGIPLLPGLDGVEALRRLFFEPTCTLCGLGIGYTGPGVKTIIPNDAHAKIDMRLPPGISPQIALVHLQRHLHSQGFDDIEIQPLVGMHAARTAPDAPIVQAARRAVQQVYGQPPIVYPLMPASGPMYDLCQAQGTPAVCLGATHPGSGAHSVDENIYIEDYFAMMRTFCLLLREFAAL
ncbi:MAG: M20/M25/M40 family metallo-hydrolase [Anaerolineales bacterium]